MLWVHADHPERRVRLGYCLNLHAAETLEELFASLRGVTLPLRDRFRDPAARSGAFGVGMYIPARLAGELVAPAGGAGLEALREFLGAEGLDPFTWNAFPFGDFQTDGLKERVYEPLWTEAARARYTLDVAHLAQSLVGEDEGRSHISISTHGGRYGAWEAGEAERAQAELRGVLRALAASEGIPVVLSVEAEPCSSASDTRAAAAWVAGLDSENFALCLDCCHSAVEFEDAEAALALCRAAGLGKVQFSSALRLEDPATHPQGVEALLALDEPRFLHQVLTPDADVRASDLPSLAAALATQQRWLQQAEWRCHFHVPVDLQSYAGLGTTSAHADRLVTGLLEAPQSWHRTELHLEIETYTWSVLANAPSDGTGLVDALEKEYRHVIALLRSAGWERA